MRHQRRQHRLPFPSFPRGLSVSHIFRWTRGVTETRTESGLSAPEGRNMIAQGKRAGEQRVTQRALAESAPSTGVGEWGLNNCPEPDQAHPLCPAHRLVAKDQPNVGNGWGVRRIPPCCMNSRNSARVMRGLRAEPRSMVRIADSASRGKRPWRSRCRWLGLKRLRALRRATRFR